jgi:hypothetical protein
MKLSHILDLLERLELANPDAEITGAINKLHNLDQIVSSDVVQVDSVAADFSNHYNSIVNAIQDFKITSQYLVTRLKQVAESIQLEYYRESTRLYEQEMVHDNSKTILDRRLRYAEDESLRSCIKQNADWRLPGMIIRPGLENYIEDMVPLDPLYVVDQREELIRPSIDKFTQEYQRRLRPYVIDENNNNNNIFWQLPDRQFGFVFAYNFFNYKPIEVVERYLRDLYPKLRTGGSVVFTYNDCDIAQGAGLAEQSFMCFTPGSKIRRIAQDLGYEIARTQIGPINIAWMHLRKPGDIESVRGGQTLAQLLPK